MKFIPYTRQQLHVGMIVRVKWTARHVRVLAIKDMGLGFSPTLAMVEVEDLQNGSRRTVESESLIVADDALR